MDNLGFVTALESRDFAGAQGLIEKALYQKAGVFLEEKKKAVVAKTWPNTLTEDAKSIQAASLRKAFREKMMKLKENK